VVFTVRPVQHLPEGRIARENGMSEEAEKKEGGEEHAEPPKSKKKLLIIVVVLLLAIGGGAFAMLGGSKPPAAETEEVEEKKEYKLAEVETLVVNLSESTSFLKTKLLLEYDPSVLHPVGEEGAEGGGGHGGGHGGGGGGASPTAMPPELVPRLPMIQDAIIRVLSSKRATDVLTNAGKETLKQELIEAINEVTGFDEPVVVNVYFTEFIIQ
jgi:flagellar FliL protein